MTLFFSILIFLVVLFVLILVHEWGHYIAAKKTGMRVDEFGIGFPPTVLSYKIGETTYKLNYLPIGGYVKILGEDGDLNQDLSEVDKKRIFSARPRWAQAVVLSAGVFMNVVLAWFLLIVVAMLGSTTAIDESVRTDTAVLRVVGILPESPASALPLGLEIITVETTIGDTLADLLPSTFTEFVANNNESEFVITYRDNEQIYKTNITPAVGLLADDPERAVLGVQLALTDTVRYTFFEAVLRASEQTLNLLKAIVVGITAFFMGLFLGNADLSQVAGPVGIVSYVGEAATFGFSALLFFTAVISLNLAIINLLPIPALDGGRLVFVAIESIIRRPINPIWMARVNTVGFLFLIGVMILVTVSDVSKLF